jgi:CRISPR system Cascade subunit CasA
MGHHFNLMSKPWIPVRSLGGELKLASLRTVLLEAHLLRRIEDPSPLVVAALHRLCLAVLHRALRGPADGAQAVKWLMRSLFPEAELEDYLESWHARFDLFGTDFPFYQVPDLTLDISKKPWTFLLPERTWGNRPLLFDHTRHDEPPAATPAEAAQALVVHQTFVLGGLLRIMGVSSAPGAPVARAALVLPLGETLFETLAINLIEYPNQFHGIDQPIWEREPLRAAELGRQPAENPRGPAHRYTWLSRGVRLMPEESAGQSVVRWIAYGPGVEYLTGDVFDPDPMCAYRRTERFGYLQVGFREGRGFWRDFPALLPHSGERTKHIPPRVLEQTHQRFLLLHGTDRLIPVTVLGQASDQAKVLFWRSEVFPLSETVYSSSEARDAILWSIRKAEECGNSLRSIGRKLARELITRSERSPEEAAKLARAFPLLPGFWSALEAAFPTLLAGLAPGFADAQVRSLWLGRLITAAREAWDETLLSIGTSAQAIRAAELADRGLGSLLRRLLDEAASLKAVA